jgi:hypothetical protein
VLDLDSGLAVMSGSASSGEGAARGRVTGTFLVPKREN